MTINNKVDDNRRSNSNEKILDALLKIAAEDVAEEEVAALPSPEELNNMHYPSDSLEKRVRAMITKDEKTKKRKKVMRGFVKAAAVFGLMFTVSAVALMAVEGSRIFIINTFINIQDDHMVFDFHNEVEAGAGNIDDHFEFAIYGFEYVTSQAFENSTMTIFVNPAGQQIIITRDAGTSLRAAVDTDYRTFSQIIIGNREAYFFESDTPNYHHVIMWTDSDVVYQVLSDVEIGHFLRLAESLIVGQHEE